VIFAIESQLDMIAGRLGMDKLKIRLKNCAESGDVTACGWKITSCGLRECLLKAAKEIGWEERKRNPIRNRGIGIASMIHVSGAKVYTDGDFSAACIQLMEDGTTTIFSGTTDCGQGSTTTLAMIAAEELGVSLDEIRMVTMDTTLTPIDLGSWGSRITFVGGNTIRQACRDVKKQLFDSASKKLECNPEDMVLKDKKVYVAGSPGKSLLVGEAILESPQRVGKMLIGRGHYDPPSELVNRQTGIANISAAYGFAAQAVEVEVDEQTGKVKVLRVVAAHDAGRAINPQIVEGQIEGAVLQGMGYALSERVILDEKGRVRNDNFLDYKILFSEDMPKVETHIIETLDPEGPFGAKGIGEPGLIPTAPAIANAIEDAVGVRIQELPILQEKVYWGLKEKK
jgi:xanthine dehydrogenase molybdenum-binding subunit